MQALPGRGEWDEAVLSLGLRWEVIFGGWKGSALPKLPRWLWAGCMQALGWWISMAESYCAVWSFGPLKWYLDTIWSFGWSDSIPRASALSDQGRWRTAGEKRVMKGRWGKGIEKGRAHARGKTTIFQGRTSFSKHRYDNSLFQTARANTAHRNKLASLAFIQDLKRQKKKNLQFVWYLVQVILFLIV